MFNENIKNEAENVYCQECGERAGCIPENNAQEGRVYQCLTIGCKEECQEVMPSEAFYQREQQEISLMEEAELAQLMEEEEGDLSSWSGCVILFDASHLPELLGDHLVFSVDVQGNIHWDYLYA